LVTPSLKRFNVLEALDIATKLVVQFFRSLVSFSRLQGCALRLTGWETGTFQGFFPFSAAIVSWDKFASRQIALRPQVFATSRQYSNLTNLRFYSTPLALLGFSLQSLTTNRLVHVFRFPCSFAVFTFSWFPSSFSLTSPCHDHNNLTCHDPCDPEAPSLSDEEASILSFDRP
jgi:hypothetical protein